MSDVQNAGPPKSTAQLALEIYNILEGHSSDVRKRAIHAAMASLGEASTPISQGVAIASLPQEASEFADTKIGPKALKWISKNGLTREQLDEIFHLTGDSIEITASEIPGSGKNEMTTNCYLLMGARGLLQSDEPKLNESETVALCKKLTAYDKNNHPTFRKNVGNKVTGQKPDFILTGPGEKAAAELIKTMLKA